MGQWESRVRWGKGLGRGSVDASGREGTGNHTHTQGFGISLILIRRTTRNPRQPESVGSEFTYGIVGRDVHDTDALAKRVAGRAHRYPWRLPASQGR